jgi:putative ABC transport system permease protein
MLFNAFLLSVREIRRNLMRSFLTILGIVIGVAAVVTMVTLGNGTTEMVRQQIASLGNNLIMLRPGARLGPGRDAASSPNFRVEDADAIREQVSAARYVVPTANTGALVVNQARNWSTSITGATADYFAAANWVLADGRVFTASEERSGRAVCVVGDTIRRELFAGENPVGARLRVRSFSCEVIGLLRSKGQSAMGHDQDDTVVMPLRTVQRRLTGRTDVRLILVSLADGAEPAAAMRQITTLMRERRRLDEGQENNFNLMDTRQIAETMSSTVGMMTALLGAVAAVSLLVGGIGIMNIMLVSVTERTREIGIRLAIGALEREVLLQFLIEAVTLSSLGGLVGILLAFGASWAGSAAMGIPFLFDPAINLLAFLFSAAIGVLFGFLPARRAARLNPIDALRHE